MSIIKTFWRKIGQFAEGFFEDESGIGVVEIILILVVLIGLVVIFRDQLTDLMNSIFERIIEDSNAV